MGPLRELFTVSVGASRACAPLAISEQGLLEQWTSAKQQSRLTNQSPRAATSPLGQPPLEVSRETLQWGARNSSTR